LWISLLSHIIEKRESFLETDSYVLGGLKRANKSRLSTIEGGGLPRIYSGQFCPTERLYSQMIDALSLGLKGVGDVAQAAPLLHPAHWAANSAMNYVHRPPAFDFRPTLGRTAGLLNSCLGGKLNIWLKTVL